MGYTVYFHAYKSKRGSKRDDSIKYAKALADIRTFLLRANMVHKSEHGQSIVSGHTPHSSRNHGYIDFNGAHGDLCENFHLPAMWSEVECTSNFCKTNGLPYTDYVKAAVLILHNYLPHVTGVSADDEDWQNAVDLLKKYLYAKKNWNTPSAASATS